MKPTKEQIDAYKEIAKASPTSMKAMIEENLKATCDKFPGNEDKLDGCIDYLTKCAREILGGKNCYVPDEVCFRICRDYFNDEIWKKEDEEEAKKKAEREKLEAKRKVKVKKKIEALKNEPDKKFEKCSKCKKDFLHLWKDGLCLKCFEKKEKADAAAAEKLKAKHVVKVIKPEKVITSGNVKTCQDVKTPELALAEKMKAIVEENNRKLGISEAKPINMFSEAV